MAVLGILWLRDLKRYGRGRARLVAALGPPLLYMFVLGFGLGPVFERSGAGSYLEFVVPGVIAMSLLFTSSLTGMMVMWDRQVGSLKATMVAPVSRIQILAGRTLGGSTAAMVQGMFVFLASLVAGFRPHSFGGLLLAFLFMALIAVLFNIVGTAIGSVLREFQQGQLAMNLVLAPLFFLSGALFPLSNLPPPLALAVRVDPLTYGVDGLRAALTGATHFSVAVDLAVLSGVVMVVLVIGTYLFSRIQT